MEHQRGHADGDRDAEGGNARAGPGDEASAPKLSAAIARKANTAKQGLVTLTRDIDVQQALHASAVAERHVTVV